MKKIQESKEDYLETILVLQQQKGSVRSVDIAHHLNYSKPSISRAMNLLKNEGYLENTKGNLTLTAKGLKKAEQIYQRHRILRCWLENELGIQPEVAETDACHIEHVISEATFEALRKLVEDKSL
ncbi:MAG: metal-dependent transcriptional regulator [Erysipelotrichaceae bacterium]|jgi:Mn-dependent DtxR family transcriptional regulator|nr:metal-dependent transcriptional regulator [Erysipelotrichaceae bacterium]